jgi:hypothetical protein
MRCWRNKATCGVETPTGRRDAGVTEAVGNIGAKQAAVGPDVNPESLFRRVEHHFVRELRTQQRFASHQREYPAAVIVEPVDGTPRNILGHAFHSVVVGSAIPAVEIALVLDK